MRIVGGRLRGRNLAAPRSDAIRPTSDRLRESVFNILAHAYGDPVAGARVLDLFAGTGALGLQVNRLIRVSYGPFQLGELPAGTVEEVATRTLRDQLGERLTALAGADFSAAAGRRQ